MSVFTPAPGGGTSGILPFAVLQAGANPAPSITLTAPSAASAGGSGFTLTVDGLNFVPGSQVLWNNSSRTTTFVNSQVLTAQITAGDLSASGTRQVSVPNPTPGGGVATAVNYTLYPPGANTIPALTSLSTASASTGAAAFTLTVNGSNFTSSSVVQWNGSNRATKFVSAAKLTAGILAGDLASAGFALVTVFNTGSTGGVSNALTLTVGSPTIGSPPPAVSSGGIVPVYSNVATVQPGEWVSIYGTNLASSTVIWTGNAVPSASCRLPSEKTPDRLARKPHGRDTASAKQGVRA